MRILDKWPHTENVKKGSPIVWANRIFLTIASVDGERRAIAAYDRATGRKLWGTYPPDTHTTSPT